MTRFTLFATGAAIAFALQSPGSACAAQLSTTVPISKTVPSNVKSTHAPDNDPPYYQTMDGTHFSYRCFDPYTLAKRQAAVEVCEMEPVKLKILYWPETEVIHLIRGQVTITESTGAVRQYSAGDIFVLPEGFTGTWNQPERISKVVVRQPLFWND